MTENSQENEVQYDLSFLFKPKWLISFFVFFTIVLITNFPLSKEIDKIVYSSLSISSTCKLQITDYEINIFPLPHVAVKNLNVPGSCMGPGKRNIFIPETRAYFRGPSFSPLGVLFKIETELKGLPLEVYITAGTATISVVLKESLIPLDKLKDFLPAVKLAGQVKADLYIELKNMKIQTINVNLQSKTFLIPAQNIEGYNIETLNIQDMQLIAATDKKSNLKISKFILGNDSSPVRSNFKGQIKMDNRNFINSVMDIKGELALSQELNDSLGFVLAQFTKVDNFYQIQLSGPLRSPKMGSKR